MTEENPFQTHWSQHGHNICLGHWDINYQGEPIQLPAEKQQQEMGTFGIYSYLYPDDPDFAEGFEEQEWILQNLEWLIPMFEEHQLPVDEQHLSWFYQSINHQDWRCGSCGGCI